MIETQLGWQKVPYPENMELISILVQWTSVTEVKHRPLRILPELGDQIE